jgi:hypothetical protein
MADNVNITVVEDKKTIQVQNIASATAVTFDNTSSNLVASNLRDAIDELDHRVAVGTSPSTTGIYAEDGDLFYDTDDDELLVRREGAWKEIVIETTTGDIDGGTFT